MDFAVKLDKIIRDKGLSNDGAAKLIGRLGVHVNAMRVGKYIPMMGEDDWILERLMRY